MYVKEDGFSVLLSGVQLYFKFFVSISIRHKQNHPQKSCKFHHRNKRFVYIQVVFCRSLVPCSSGLDFTTLCKILKISCQFFFFFSEILGDF